MKRTERVQNGRRLLNLQNATGGKQVNKTTQLQTRVTFHEKGKMTQGRANRQERRTKHSEIKLKLPFDIKYIQ